MSEYPTIFEGCEIKVIHLSHDIVVVAKQGYGGKDWSAYIDFISGDIDQNSVVKYIVKLGSKLHYKFAAFLFPEFDKKYEWRS